MALALADEFLGDKFGTNGFSSPVIIQEEKVLSVRINLIPLENLQRHEDIIDGFLIESFPDFDHLESYVAHVEKDIKKGNDDDISITPVKAKKKKALVEEAAHGQLTITANSAVRISPTPDLSPVPPPEERNQKRAQIVRWLDGLQVNQDDIPHNPNLNLNLSSSSAKVKSLNESTESTVKSKTTEIKEKQVSYQQQPHMHSATNNVHLSASATPSARANNSDLKMDLTQNNPFMSFLNSSSAVTSVRSDLRSVPGMAYSDLGAAPMQHQSYGWQRREAPVHNYSQPRPQHPHHPAQTSFHRGAQLPDRFPAPPPLRLGAPLPSHPQFHQQASSSQQAAPKSSTARWNIAHVTIARQIQEAQRVEKYIRREQNSRIRETALQYGLANPISLPYPERAYMESQARFLSAQFPAPLMRMPLHAEQARFSHHAPPEVMNPWLGMNPYRFM